MENTNTNTNNESLKGVRILRSFYEGLDEFTYEEKGRMFEAIMEYGLNGVEPNFDSASDARALRAIWKTYLPVINNSINRAIVSNKNGNKGGAPKKSNDVVEPSKTSTENKAPELTIISQPIVEVQKQEIVSEIDYNELEIDISVIFSDAMRIDGKIDDEKFDYFSEVIRKLKINIPNFEGSFIKYKTLKQIKPLIDSTNVNDDFKIDCYDCIDKFNPYEYKESDYQIMCNNLNKKELV
jgi:hypothetical protein